MTLGDENLALRRITLLERNSEFSDAAEGCFQLHKQTGITDFALRGFKNLAASVWRAKNASEMIKRLSQTLQQIETMGSSIGFSQEQNTCLEAMTLEVEGWLANPPDPDKLAQAIQLLVSLGEHPHALELISSLVAFVKPEEQVKWTKYGLELAETFPAEQRDSFYILLVEPLIQYSENSEKKALLNEVLHRIKALNKISSRSHYGNLAILKGIDLIHPYRLEADLMRQIRQDNVHELIRSLSNETDNRIRGMMLSLLGGSYYRMAELEEDSDIRQDLFKEAKDYFLQSVLTLERTPAYGELLQAYTLAGTGFLSIAELEQDFEHRNEFYRLGQTHLQKSRIIGQKTQLYHLRARAAINLGVARERLSWFEYDPERRKEVLMVIYELQLEGKELAEKTKGFRGAGYATMNASEMCGFLSDLETRLEKKLEWAQQQRELSQKGLALLEQTQDIRGQVVALSYAAFACAKLASLTPEYSEKESLFQEMHGYAKKATELAQELPDPVVTAYAFQQAGDASKNLGIIEGNVDLLNKAAGYYEQAVIDWAKTGERHKQAEVLTQQADMFLFQSGLTHTNEKTSFKKLLKTSERIHQQAAKQFSKLFFFHDAGENYWRIGQIRLLQSDFIGAQEIFDKVQKSFVQMAQLVPNLADAYSVFSTFGITFVGLVDGLNIITQGNYLHASKLFKELASELSHETDRSLRWLRQLLEALSTICEFKATEENAVRNNAQTQLNRLQKQISQDAYDQRLPYGLHMTIQQLHVYLKNPEKPFPAVLLDLPLQEKMLAMAQTRHIVSTAFNLYQTTTDQREVVADEPTEDVIRSYIARISGILAER